MKILIVENEIYLAQSISTKLNNLGHSCELAVSVKDALRGGDFDAVLLSTNISGQNFYPIIEHYKNSIIILMVSYVSNDTVTAPLKAGANDYILKPFMIEELIRKLEHLQDYIQYRKENQTYKNYINHLLKKSIVKKLDENTEFPILLKVSSQKVADSMVFKYVEEFNESFTFISLEDKDALRQLEKINPNELVYLTDFQNLQRSEKSKVLPLIQKRRVILSTTDMYESLEGLESLEIKNEESLFDREGELLSIENYVKYVILKYQGKFPDTELSKKLGISRKSLWEKRKKYGITKKR
jgi:DNA-binding NtrC family response regulator